MTNDFQVDFFSFNYQKQWKLSVCKKSLTKFEWTDYISDRVNLLQPPGTCSFLSSIIGKCTKFFPSSGVCFQRWVSNSQECWRHQNTSSYWTSSRLINSVINSNTNRTPQSGWWRARKGRPNQRKCTSTPSHHSSASNGVERTSVSSSANWPTIIVKIADM